MNTLVHFIYVPTLGLDELDYSIGNIMAGERYKLVSEARYTCKEVHGTDAM